MNTKLSKSLQKTYDAILRHPVAHNIHWREVTSLLNAIGKVELESNGHLKASRNGDVFVLHAGTRQGVVGTKDLAAIRHFLQRSETSDLSPPPAENSQILVFVDHREAHIWKNAGEDPQRIVSPDSDGSGRYLHNAGNDSNGQRRPEVHSYYEAIACAIGEPKEIILFGCGTGASSAMEHFLSVLREGHPGLAKRVIATAVVDPHHATEAQLRAKARELYAHSAA